jgi:hypothetical protein
MLTGPPDRQVCVTRNMAAVVCLLLPIKFGSHCFTLSAVEVLFSGNAVLDIRNRNNFHIGYGT